jgi:aminoglycoside phosphotransferase
VNAKRHILPAPEPQHLAAPQDAYRLAGHSGARLMLLSRDGGHIVRKSSGSPAKNERLLAQAERQRQFFFSGIAVPRIFETGIDEGGHAYFEMDYIPGRTLADMIATGAPFDPQPVEQALARLFTFLHLTASGTIAPAAFLAKISEIAACGSEICRAVHEPIARAASRLRAADWSGVPQSLGHGDLTLENILISPERGVVFIDCDSCFASSSWLDAGKLFQDVAGHWCLRKLYGHAGPALVNAVQQMEVLRAPLVRLISSVDPALPPRLSQFAALHLFRTLPYVRDAATADFVLARLEKVLPP